MVSFPSGKEMRSDTTLTRAAAIINIHLDRKSFCIQNNSAQPLVCSDDPVGMAGFTLPAGTGYDALAVPHLTGGHLQAIIQWSN